MRRAVDFLDPPPAWLALVCVGLYGLLRGPLSPTTLLTGGIVLLFLAGLRSTLEKRLRASEQ